MTAPQRTFYDGRWRRSPIKPPVGALFNQLQQCAIDDAELGTLVKISGGCYVAPFKAESMPHHHSTIRALIRRGIFRDRDDGSVALTDQGRDVYFRMKGKQ